MSRPLRIEYPGAWYHVMNRGRRQEDIFFSLGDRRIFIKVLQETAEMWNLEVAAYCLMPNHYHLLLHTPKGNLSRCMRNINGVYTQRFNRSHKFDGQLFRGRYKSVLVDSDGYLLEVLRYIHQNPLRAGLVKELGDFPWSSHKGYLSKAQKWHWLYTDFLLTMLSRGRRGQQAAYRKFVGQASSEEVDRFYSLKKLPPLLGSDTFKKSIKERFSALLTNREVPESKALAVSPIEIISGVCDYFQITKDELMASRRGQENLPREIALYLIRYHTGKTLLEVGDCFGIDSYSTVSSVIQRVNKRIHKDRMLRKYLEEIIRAF